MDSFKLFTCKESAELKFEDYITHKGSLPQFVHDWATANNFTGTVMIQENVSYKHKEARRWVWTVKTEVTTNIEVSNGAGVKVNRNGLPVGT